MAAESPVEVGARSPGKLSVALAAAGLVALGLAPMAPELARAECAASIEQEADRASDFGETPRDPGVVCDAADFLNSVGHRVGSLLGLAGRE